MSLGFVSFQSSKPLRIYAVYGELFSPAVNPGDKSDEQKPGNDRLTKE
jgi:hypothetical protein